MRIASSAALAALLAGCGGTAGNNAATVNLTATGNATQADAAQQQPVPCSVLAHGMTRGPNAADCDRRVDPQTLALDDLIRIIPDQHPAFYYVLAQRLFAANRKDEAVFWLYAGQLRYRIRLSCHPDLQPDTEPALFGSLQETVGRPVNEYAGADPAAWAAAVERARAWDAETRNGFEPKAACATAIAEQREGMGQLITQLRANPDAIRQQRAANGLRNR